MSDTDKLEELDNENIQEEKTDESVENGGGNENREIDNHEEIDVHQETGDKLDEIDENKIEESEVNLSGKDENKDEEVDENKDGKIDENKDEKIDENKDGEVGENKDGEVDENKDGEVDENEGEEEVEDEEGIDPNAIIENLEDRIESERYENELQEEHGDESEEKEEFPPQLKDEDEKEEEDYPNEAALIQEESDEKFREYIQHSLQEYNSILADNYDLQRKYATYLSNNPTDAVIGGTDDSDKTEDELKTDFYQQLSTIENLREEGAAINNSVNEILQNLKNQVINKKQELENVLETFNQYKRQVALQSRNSKNGLGLEKNDVEQLIAREAEKDKEINERRLRNITLQNKLNKMGDKESDSKQAHRHQIDFEQLKIENQTFNEKIEERTEELQKLRKKINITVHVLSHYTEKLEFVHSANNVLKQKLSVLEKEQTEQRDKLSNIKLERDRLKEQNQRLRQENGLSGNDELLRDFKDRRKRVIELRKQLLGVQKKYEQLTGENVMVFNEKLFRAADEGLKKGAEEGEGEEEEEEEEGNVEEDGGEGFKEESAVNNGKKKLWKK